MSKAKLTPKTHPTLQVKFIYKALEISIRVWEQKGSWLWEALGNGGQEKTSVEALQSAKRWIRDRQ